MKILFIGDIVGKPARSYLKEILPSVRKDLGLDFIIANGENAAGGSSLTPDTAEDIFVAGVDVMTSGDHIFKKKEAREVLDTRDLIRPLNYGDLAYGRGYIIKEVGGVKIGIINLIGRVFMQPVDCPFKAVKSILEDVKREAKIIFVGLKIVRFLNFKKSKRVFVVYYQLCQHIFCMCSKKFLRRGVTFCFC